MACSGGKMISKKTFVPIIEIKMFVKEDEDEISIVGISGSVRLCSIFRDIRDGGFDRSLETG
jgi:hypothetical protein